MYRATPFPGAEKGDTAAKDISLSLEKIIAIVPSLDAILKEMREVSDERLHEVYQFIHSLNPKFKSTVALKKKILSFAGSFSTMNNKDYADFTRQTRKTRSKLFSRNIDI